MVCSYQKEHKENSRTLKANWKKNCIKIAIIHKDMLKSSWHYTTKLKFNQIMPNKTTWSFCS